MKIVFATSNVSKFNEAKSILKIRISRKDIELDEIQSVSTEQVARHKALQAYRKLKVPVIVEDTGLYIKGLNGFPGALIKWVAAGIGYEKICRLVDLCEDRNAYAETCTVFYDGKVMKTFVGRIDGRIAVHPMGRRNFGWDYIFVPTGSAKTFAQISAREKNKISMRRISLEKLHRFLASNGLI